MRVLSWTFSDRFKDVYADLQNRSLWPIQFRLDPHLKTTAAIKVPRPDQAGELVPLRMHPALSQRSAQIAALHELGHLHLALLGYPGVWQRRKGKVAHALSANLTNLIHHPLIRPWAEAQGFDYTPHLDNLATLRKKSTRPQLRLFVRPKYPAQYAANVLGHAGEYLEYDESERSQVAFPYNLPKKFKRDVDALVKRVDETDIENPNRATRLLRDLIKEYKIGRYVIVLGYDVPALEHTRDDTRGTAPGALCSH